MINPNEFKGLFKQAGEYCNQCYLTDKNGEKDSRKNFQALSNNLLAVITNTCQDKETKGIVEGSVNACRNCDYKDPNIFKYLESRKII